MSDSLEFTGERFTPECVREIRYEHYHRYAFAARYCENLRILDAACGEGYGSAILAASATKVDAVDLSADAIKHAKRRYGHITNLRFQTADCTVLPFSDNEFDRVVSFETLEHLAEHDALLAEFRRVLKPDGILILSSPDKAEYSDQHNASNEFHVKELYRDELEALLNRHFGHWCLLGQKLMFHSVIWSLEGVEKVILDQQGEGRNGEVGQGNASGGDESHSRPDGITQPAMYFIALCAAEEAMLPKIDKRLWMYDDREESVYTHYYGEIKRNMAAGGIIAGLEKEIESLQEQLNSGPGGSPVSQQLAWWQRLLGKD